MTKDYTDWEIVEESTPDYSGWELVESGSTPPPAGFLESFNRNPITQGFKTGVERTTYGLLQALFPQNRAIREQMQEQEAAYGRAQEEAPWQSLLGNILGGVGSTLPTAIAGGAVASRAIPALAPFVGSTAGNLLGGSLAAATEGGLLGGSQYVNPDETRLGNTLAGAGIGGATHGLLQGLGLGGKALKNYLSPSAEALAEKAAPGLTAAELLARQEAAKGTATPLGDIIGSKELKTQLENQLGNRFGSRSLVNDKFATLEEQISNKTRTVLDKLGEKYSQTDTNELTKELLTKSFDVQTKAKNKLFEGVDKIAKAEGFSLNLPKFSEKALESIEAIDSSLVAKADPALRKALNAVKNVERGVSNSADISLKDAQILARKLSENSAKFGASSSSSDRYLAGLFNDLSGALRNDIKSEVSSRGSSALQEALSGANANYREKFSGFLDKDVYKFIQEGKDADAIVREIVKPSKVADKAARIRKIQNLLPKEDRNLMGYSLLEKSITPEGMLDARKVNNLLNQLGDKQFKALFPDEVVRKELKDLQKLYSLNSEALNRMYNPKTGARNVESLGGLKDIVTGIASGQIGGPAGAATTLGASALHNRNLTNKLTNELFRDEVIRNILNSKNASSAAKGSSATGRQLNKALQVWLTDNRRED